MNELHNNLARKYAQAFLNLYEQELDNTFLISIEKMIVFLEKNRWLYYSLSIATSDNVDIQNIVQRIGQVLGCCHHVSLLMNTLLQSKRIELLEAVLRHVIKIHNYQHDIEIFTISTSHELTSQEQERLLTLLRSLKNQTVTATFVVDTSLICGIKIQSDRSFFERSIARQLKNFEQSLLQRVCL